MALIWSLNSNSVVIQRNQGFKSNFTVIRSLHIRIYIVVKMYIKGHVKTVDTKDQSNATVYWVWYLVCHTVDMKIKHAVHWMLCLSDCRYTGVCGSYTTPYTEYYELWKLCIIKWPLTPAMREGYLYLKSLLSWGFSCSPVSLRRQLC